MTERNILLFDLDGTLTDSAPGVINSFDYALRAFGIHVADKSELKRVVGPPLSHSFCVFYGVPREKLPEVLEVYHEYYTPRGIFENSVYPGVEDMLSRLRDAGKTLVLASSKREDHVYEVMEHFGLDKYFHFMAGSVDSQGRPDKPGVIRHIIKSLHITDLTRALMIGDRMYDVEGASQCGIDTLGALWGYGTRDELLSAGAIAVCATPGDCADMLLGQ